MCASPTKFMLLSAGAVIEIEQTLEFEPRELDFYFFGAFSPLRVVQFSVIMFAHHAESVLK